MKDSILLDRVFSRVFIAQFISGLIDRMIVFILPLWILEMFKAPIHVSIFSAVTMAITIISAPIMGTLVDRLSKRKLMILADAARFSFILLLAVVTFITDFNYIFILFIFIFYTFGSTLYSPASNVALTLVAEEKKLQEAVSLRQISNQMESVLAPLLGGLLFAVLLPEWLFVINAVCFLLSCIILLITKFPSDPVQNKKKSFLTDLKEGFRIMKESNLKIFIISAAIINILGASIMLSLQVFVIDMEVSRIVWGWLFASSPIGIIIGSTISRKLKLNQGLYTDAFIFCALMGVFNVIMGFASTPIFLGIAYFFSGVFFGMSNVYFGIMYRKLIPVEHQGRFFSFLGSSLLVAIPIGLLTTGMLLEVIRSQWLISIFGVLTVIAALVSLSLLKRTNTAV